MYFTQAPKYTDALKPITALKSGSHSGHTEVPDVQLRAQDRVTDTLGNVEMDVVNLIERIPYYSNGGAMNTGRSAFLRALPFVNYQTLRAICVRLLDEPDTYWKDGRDRDFSGIEAAIETRFEELGYNVADTQERHYIGSETMKRIRIPVSVNKK